ncbi:hypothetical protein [Streptomyces sp. NPDC017993]|uniref:hypothetical protein n=1 Tax=Streptomyces sp. NPDC017993 TaxID=3365027 RepID=UPI0037B6B2D8
MQTIEQVQRRIAAREASLTKARERLANSEPGTQRHRRAGMDVEQLELAVSGRKAHLEKLIATQGGRREVGAPSPR